MTTFNGQHNRAVTFDLYTCSYARSAETPPTYLTNARGVLSTCSLSHTAVLSLSLVGSNSFLCNPVSSHVHSVWYGCQLSCDSVFHPHSWRSPPRPLQPAAQLPSKHSLYALPALLRGLQQLKRFVFMVLHVCLMAFSCLVAGLHSSFDPAGQ